MATEKDVSECGEESRSFFNYGISLQTLAAYYPRSCGLVAPAGCDVRTLPLGAPRYWQDQLLRMQRATPSL